jgi:outer membrane lipoprotein-sorting protein
MIGIPRTTKARFDCDLFSESDRPLLWKIPHIPNSMNITQTLTFSVIALLTSTFAFSDDFDSLLTPSGRGRPGTGAQGGRTGELLRDSAVRGREFAQADPAEKSAAAATSPRDILLSASDKLKSHASVRANMTEKVTMQTNSFTAKGSYLQGQNLQLRMEFTVELRAQKASLLEVCDGQVLWSRHDLGEKDQTQITRRDVRQILKATEQAEQTLKTADEKSRLNASIVADLGIGGLPALLAAFAKDYDFTKATDGKIDDRDVVILEGTWNAEYRAMWQGAKSKDKTPPALPIYIPDSVRLSLDKETEFPRRIEYLKLIPGQSVPSVMMSVDFTKVVFNGKVSKDDFVFIPPERPAPIDITQMYLQRLIPPKAPPAKSPPVPTSPKPAAK